jgi:hypothetical protein
MSKRAPHVEAESAGVQLDLSHLRRDARTALELAVVSLAPEELVERLAAAAGMLEALVELPMDTAPVVALVPRVEARARRALDDWQKWQQEHFQRIPRG